MYMQTSCSQFPKVYTTVTSCLRAGTMLQAHATGAWVTSISAGPRTTPPSLASPCCTSHWQSSLRWSSSHHRTFHLCAQRASSGQDLTEQKLCRRSRLRPAPIIQAEGTPAHSEFVPSSVMQTRRHASQTTSKSDSATATMDYWAVSKVSVDTPTRVIVIGVDPDSYGGVTAASWLTHDMSEPVDVGRIEVRQLPQLVQTTLQNTLNAVTLYRSLQSGSQATSLLTLVRNLWHCPCCTRCACSICLVPWWS